jgi:hypothetical protein
VRTRYSTFILAADLLAIFLGLTLNACSSAPAYQATGYETDAGYMQPDHRLLLLLADVSRDRSASTSRRVSYHVYVPPSGYPTTYRPWYSRPSVPSYAPSYTRPLRRTNARPDVGRLQRLAVLQPASRRHRGAPRRRARTSGGFSSYAPRPSAPAAPRASGGFSAPRPSTSMPSRTSGGFSSGRRR